MQVKTSRKQSLSAFTAGDALAALLPAVQHLHGILQTSISAYGNKQCKVNETEFNVLMHAVLAHESDKLEREPGDKEGCNCKIEPRPPQLSASTGVETKGYTQKPIVLCEKQILLWAETRRD